MTGWWVGARHDRGGVGRSAFLLWQASPIVAERPLGLSKNCYYIGKNPLYATGDYRQRMEGVLVKAAIKRGQKSLLILLSVSRLGRRPRQSSNDVKIRKSRPGAFS